MLERVYITGVMAVALTICGLAGAVTGGMATRSISPATILVFVALGAFIAIFAALLAFRWLEFLTIGRDGDVDHL